MWTEHSYFFFVGIFTSFSGHIVFLMQLMRNVCHVMEQIWMHSSKMMNYELFVRIVCLIFLNNKCENV
jgi:hypothetical protein